MLQRTNKPILKRVTTTVIIIGMVSIFILAYAPVRGAVTNVLYRFSPWIFSTGDTIIHTWSAFVGSIRDKNLLMSENILLRKEITYLRAEVLSMVALKEEIATLKETLGRNEKTNQIIAKVISVKGKFIYGIFIIDVGTKQGIAVHDLVTHAGAGIIGEIMEVSHTSSKVKLYSAFGQEHAVVIGPKFIPAIAYGHGMGNFEAHLPPNSIVVPGDSVVTQETNHILGAVSFVEEKPTAPFVTVLFRSPFNISEIRSVEVIRKIES